MVDIQGRCDARFHGVREVFERAFERGDELGAAVCITVGGETVVDLWAGFTDETRETPWQRDTLANVYSTTKGLTAIAAHQLVEEGKLDLDAPVATYWPEFAQAGKETLPVRYLLSHEAGLAAIEEPLPAEALGDWDRMVAALAAQKPWWTPGQAHGYHAMTYGWLVGELVRRLRGQSVGEVVRARIAEPLGVEFHIGCGPELDPRIARLEQGPVHVPEGDLSFFAELLANPDSVAAKAFGNPSALESDPNSRAWREAEIPAANGHTNAHSLARIFGALALGGEIDGVRILERETIDRARAEQVDGPDEVLPMRTRLGLGFFLPTVDEPLGPNPRAFGHGGAGGSYSHADPEHELGFGYVMNLMHQGAWLVDPRARALLNAAYHSL